MTQTQPRLRRSVRPDRGDLQKVLDDEVKEARVTHRLTDSPAYLVSEGWSMSAHVERILRDARVLSGTR